MRDLKPQRAFPIDWSKVGVDRYVLSIDQSLSNTGWVLLQFRSLNPPKVLDFGTVHTGSSRSLEESLVRGEAIVASLTDVLASCWERHPFEEIVHESPSLMMGSGNAREVATSQRKQEGPIIAAMAVRAAVRRHQRFAIRQLPIRMIQQISVRSWIAGDRKKTKADVHEVVWGWIPEFKTNEHVRDAIAIGIASVVDRELDREVEAWRERRASLRGGS